MRCTAWNRVGGSRRNNATALDVLAMGEWMTSANPLPLWRDGLDPIADRLKLAPCRAA